ncbi:conserved hypothetical protein [Xanthomonas oryzae pv. oryzae KACC 10331]|uniref:Uncharacterized protein n=1 Tax=Xanthomonas oryzae pv. oryzae (strain KACC10331 / KXO85) TaxID=291331 RepID=Q5H6A9_XANOR|nr:conserved hypothetical protein [Xanthomonas oryzae pv. oryzae KACC 10331]
MRPWRVCLRAQARGLGEATFLQRRKLPPTSPQAGSSGTSSISNRVMQSLMCSLRFFKRFICSSSSRFAGTRWISSSNARWARRNSAICSTISAVDRVSTLRAYTTPGCARHPRLPSGPGLRQCPRAAGKRRRAPSIIAARLRPSRKESFDASAFFPAGPGPVHRRQPGQRRRCRQVRRLFVLQPAHRRQLDQRQQLRRRWQAHAPGRHPGQRHRFRAQPRQSQDRRRKAVHRQRLQPRPGQHRLCRPVCRHRRPDVPPSLSSTLVWSPIPYPEEMGREEALFRRADHRLPARSRGRHADQGPVPTAWLQ